MTDLLALKLQLKQLDIEAQELGISKAMRDRIRQLDIVFEVVDRERQRKGWAA
jgi:hypothetical protein